MFKQYRWLVAVLVVTAGAESGSANDDVPTAQGASAWNIQLRMSEDFMNRFSERVDQKDGPVRDFVAGADIHGHQWTEARTTIDLLPFSDGAYFELTTEGVTRSSTVGVTPEACISISGYHPFTVRKPVLFDGRRLLTKSPRVDVRPNNTTRSAVTRWSSWPLLGRYADARAFEIAESRRPVSEQHVAATMSDQLWKEIDVPADEKLAAANRWLNDTAAQTLKWMDLAVEFPEISTTATHLTMKAWMLHEHGSPISAPVAAAIPEEHGLTVCVHESLLNQLTHCAGLHGRELTDRQVDRFIKRLFPLPTDRSETAAAFDPDYVPLDPTVPDVYTLILDASNPVRLRLEGGQVAVTLIAQIQPVVSGARYPIEITIPATLTLSDSQVVVEPQPLQVDFPRPVELPGGETIIDAMIRQLLGPRLKSLELARRWDLPTQSGGEAALTLQELAARDGWLILACD